METWKISYTDLTTLLIYIYKSEWRKATAV